MEIICPTCKKMFVRTTKQVNAVIRRSGKWVCKQCSNIAKNQHRARPVGETRFDSKGYVIEKTPSGWVRQHRLVMETVLGRKLLADELVHHKDENKANNSPENLEIEQWREHTIHHHAGGKRTGVALVNIRKGVAQRSTTKLNHDLVKKIKQLIAGGRTQLSIAKEFGVSPMTISRAVRGESFKHGIGE